MSQAVMTRATGQTSILIVDDLPEKHLAYEAMLEDLGPEIVSVSSGAEALRQILQQDFAVILLDVNMPDMDGFETARLIRQRKRSSATPIIFLTAFADEVRTAQGYATGAVDYLPTPVVPAILRAKVRVFVDLFEMRRQMAKQAEEHAKQAATEDANRRLSFLAEAGAVLGSSLDLQATVRDIVRLPVPALADLSVLKLNQIVGDQPQILVANYKSLGGVTVGNDATSTSLPENISDAIDRVMSSGKPERLNPGLNGMSMPGIVLPLQARGRTLGVLALSSMYHESCFDTNVYALAEAFSTRASSALDNSLLHEEIRNADRQKNDFLSMLAHELRNPLAPIRNAANLLDGYVAGDPQAKWACNVIERQVIQLVRLVDDLLDVARIARDKIQLHLEPIEISSIIDRAVEASRPVIDQRRHRLRVEAPVAPIWISGDLVRLTQVLTNLLNNSAKYTEVGGEILLTAAVEDQVVAIRVRDNGIGIPSQKLESIFDLFTQLDRALDRSHGGLGIGLTLVKRLVEMHQGSVEARSAGPGCGSEFIVRLGLISDSQNSTMTSDDPEKTQETDSRRILVVDDNHDSAETLSMMLKLKGHQTKAVFDGLQAIEAVKSYVPDIILLDIGLPKLNGYEVCRRIRALPNGNEIIIAALTGWGQAEDQVRTAEAGFDRHLVKPIDLALLDDLVQQANMVR